MRFRKYIISDGDTIQSISQHLLGDISLWVELAEFNNLKYPYIVDTVEEKLRNPDHLVTIGDTLLVRITSDEQASFISSLKRKTEYDQEEVYALSLGKDLDILPIPREFGDPSYDFEFLEMKENNSGDVQTIRGLENLKQSLFIRLITQRGSYLGHPNYGSNIHKYLGKKNTEENAALIDLEIERTLRTDGRVQNVTFNEHQISGNSYSASFTVLVMSMEEAFDFVITAYDNGPIVLTDNFNNQRR